MGGACSKHDVCNRNASLNDDKRLTARRSTTLDPGEVPFRADRIGRFVRVPDEAASTLNGWSEVYLTKSNIYLIISPK
jgi:hypothetical protein